MPLEIAKLTHVKAASGKLIARCPACAESDEDKDGKHLAAYDDARDTASLRYGRFACVTHQGDNPHRRRIFELVGVVDAEPSPPRAREEVKPKPAEPVQWSVNCERLASDDAALSRLAAWRGWSVDYCRELARAAVIGLHEGRVCFPGGCPLIR